MIRIVVGLLAVLAYCGKLQAQSENSQPVIRVMSFNVWGGGTRGGQPLAQTAKVIEKAKADVVGLQEIGGNLQKLAGMLGWKYVRKGSGGIITRLEVAKSYDGGVRLRLPSGDEVLVFNVHLSHAPYQPYQLLKIPYANAPFLRTEAEAVASAEKSRGHQLTHLFRTLKAIPNNTVPTFVTGDFNEPSHLDWTDAAAKAGRHPIKVAYPSSIAMQKAGFTDAWRKQYPDEMKKPGYTWTPLTKVGDPKDHHDRIDFVYFKGEGIAVDKAQVVGEDKLNAAVVVTPFPSDHRAMVATFRLPKKK
jgi:endonuclease/exonuclease/phosphatase family metal-dependent hydrolase